MSTQDKYAAIKSKIRMLYERHQGRYGYRRITAALRQAGEMINHKSVQRLMQQLGLQSLVRPKKYRSYRGAVGRIAPNLLERQFQAERPNQKWVTDVTEFHVNGQKLYLSPVMDLYNGEIIAWHTERRPVFRLVSSMLQKPSRGSSCRKNRYCTPTRAGSINRPCIENCYMSMRLCKACPGKETAWTMLRWKASSAR